jgi:hypothetical protein
MASLDFSKTPISHFDESSLLTREGEKFMSCDLAYDQLIQLYYQNFHPSHPFVVPRKALQTALSRQLPPYLLTMMRCIGAHYHYDSSLRHSLRQSADTTILSEDSNPQDGFKVQAMLLMAIADHASGYEERAGQTLQMAVTLALELGMNTPYFAFEDSTKNSVLEESWRRTYWELYVVSGLLATLRNQTVFVLHELDTDLSLPCDEGLYNTTEVCRRQNLLSVRT